MPDLHTAGAGWKRATAAFLIVFGLTLGASVAPALAAEQTYEVDSMGDQVDQAPGTEGCKTAVNTCTLRAAIQEANASVDRDTILFSESVFTGEAGTIELGTALPEIKAPLKVHGDACVTGAGTVPCVTLNATAVSVGFDVRADETAIEGLTINGGSVGIRILGQSGAGAGAEIIDNTIKGQFNGIETAMTIGGSGNLIEGNTIQSERLFPQGIAISNGPNRVFGNEIDGAAIAIKLSGAASGNQVGGDSPQSENVIDHTEENAIAMFTMAGAHNEIGRNRGSENSNGFIFSNQPGATASPTITSAHQTSAAGDAEPGAKVRLFRKATPEPDELQSFLGEAIADGSGKWKIAYATIPLGTQMSATQTVAGNTSTLAESMAATAEPSPPDGGGGSAGGGSTSGGNGGGSTPAPVPAPTAPDTKLTKSPKSSSTNTTATFKFTATVAGSSFQCRLDKAKFAKCRSPRTYRKLKPGRHTFQVRAVGPTGLLDKSPAKRSFTVLAQT